MKSLLYLSSRRLKNKALELLKSPLKLIISLGFVLLVVMNFSVENISNHGNRPIVEFYAVIFVFYILCFLTEVNKGFSHGGTMFSLSDVSFLFMSPLKPAAVLFYGMLSRLGSSVWMGLVFIYQFALLRSFYPISFPEMIVAVIGYGTLAFVSQTAGMLIYFFTCGDENRIKKAKAVLCFLCLIFVLVFALSVDFPSLTLTKAAQGITQPFMKLFPVAGCVFAVVEGLLTKSIGSVVLGAAVCVLFTVFVFAVLTFSKHGYYEDVLLTAEKIADSKGVREIKVEEKTLRDGNMGIGKGKGASAIFYKHRLENRRTKSTLFSPSSLFYLVLIAVYGFVFESDAIALFVMSCTVSVLTVLSGKWVKELTMPYVYILPDKPVKKLFFMLPEMLPRVLVEGLVQSLLIGFICKLGAVVVLVLFVARTTFCFVLMGAALVTARLFREKEKNNIFASVCILLGFAASLPSIFVAARLIFSGMGLVISFFAMTAVNIVSGFVMLFCARKLLNYM